MGFLDLCALLLTLAAVFGWLNHRFVGLPNTIGNGAAGQVEVNFY